MTPIGCMVCRPRPCAIRSQNIGAGLLCKQLCAAGTLYVQVHEAKDLPAAPMLRVTHWRASIGILHSNTLQSRMRSRTAIAANSTVRMRHRAFHQSKACVAASCGCSARSPSHCRAPSCDRSQECSGCGLTQQCRWSSIADQRPTMRCRYVVIRLGGLRVAHTSVWRTPRCDTASTCSSDAYSSSLCR